MPFNNRDFPSQIVFTTKPRNRSQFNLVACLSGKFIRDLWRFSLDFYHRALRRVSAAPRIYPQVAMIPEIVYRAYIYRIIYTGHL